MGRCIIWTMVMAGLFTEGSGQDDIPVHKKKKRFDIAGVPVVSYNTSYGALVGANSMIFFNINKHDTISPPSVAGLGGGFSQNRSMFAAAFTLLYLNENRWRVNVAAGVGDIRFQYYESGVEGSDEGFVDFNTTTGFCVTRVLRRIVGHLYVGGIAKLQYTSTDFESDPPVTETVRANGLGASALYDTRNDVYYPSRGLFSSLSVVTNPTWLGSDSVFSAIRAFFNSYMRVGNRAVIASRFSAFSSLGDVPFIGEDAIGGKDIRGYTEGRYRGHQSYCVQAEYRWTFRPRWGMVAFAGIAATNKPYSGLLPGAGAGLRFQALPSRNVNIGVDAAVGKGDYGVYFRIGEVF
jgi:outer membrane protein assembly factor BamA